MVSEIIQSNNSTAVVNTGPNVLPKIAFSITGSAALVENLFVVYLFIRRPQWLSQPHNRCILSLAIIDILTALSVFFASKFIVDDSFYQVSSQSFITRELYCWVIWSQFFPYTFVVTSLYICLVLALERWLAVKKSFFYKNRFKTKHMNVLILVSWIAGVVNQILFIVSVRGVHVKASFLCHWKNDDTQASVFKRLALFLGQALVPFVLIFVAYVDIFRAIKESVKFRDAAGNENLKSLKRLKKVTQMTAIASFILVTCWLPGQTYFLLSASAYNPDDLLSTLLNLLVFFNSCLNPFVYVFSNTTFRKAFKEHFCSFSVSRPGL